MTELPKGLLEAYEKRKEQLDAWLAENVIEFAEPRNVRIDEILFNSGSSRKFGLSGGTFDLYFDGVKLPERFKFANDALTPTVFRPMHTSPLGVPNSFGKVSYSYNTNLAISRACRLLMDRMRLDPRLAVNPNDMSVEVEVIRYCDD